MAEMPKLWTNILILFFYPHIQEQSHKRPPSCSLELYFLGDYTHALSQAPKPDITGFKAI